MTPTSQPEAPGPRVSAVIVSHGRQAMLRRCLEAIEKSAGRETIQAIVVDNGSRDGSASLDADFPNAQFIRLPKNFGLTKAMNLGWRAARADYVFFLHEDTELEPEATGILAACLDANPEAGAVCPLLIDGEGRPAPQLGAFPPDRDYWPAEPEGAGPVAVEYPRGAALMIRSMLIKAIRQIDERYGQFGADADLAAQIKRAGKKILLTPAARVRHHGGRPDSAALRADVLLGKVVFANKYYGMGDGVKARIVSILGPLFRFDFGALASTISSRRIDGSQP